MKNEKLLQKIIKRITGGRAARIFAVLATVFLCVFTLLEFTAFYLEWEIPVLKSLNGEETFWALEYQEGEKLFDDSAENILLENIPESTEEIVPQKKQENVLEEEQTTEQETLPEQESETAQLQQEEAEFPYYIKVNRKQNCITVYQLDEDGEYTLPYKAMICSTGLYNATPRGTFQLSTKYLWRELYGGVYGQYATRIHGGVLFHSVPYRRKSKNSLCTDKYNKLGQQASMGCIRLTVEDAKWIAENCPSGTVVEIYDDDDPGPLGKPESQKIDLDNPNKGWDPTDPDFENPWHQLSEDA